MGDFKKFGGNKGRGGDTFHRGPGGRPGLGGTQREMFKATCAECGKPCEVPFRPSGDRPVYCKDCFQAMGGPAGQDRDDRGGRDSRGPAHNFHPSNNLGTSGKRDFTPRPSYTPPMQGGGEDKRLDDLKIQMTTAISKLDKIINLIANTSRTGQKSAKTSTETLKDTLAGITAAPTVKRDTPKTKAPKKKPAKKK